MSRAPTKSEAKITSFDSVDDVIAQFRALGGRSTPSRRMLLEVLFAANDQMSAEELTVEVQKRNPDVHLSTIYRNIEDLAELGVVVHTHRGHGATTYQLATEARAHLICQSCGARVDAPDDIFRTLARATQMRVGFTIDPHHIAISGVCAACQ